MTHVDHQVGKGFLSLWFSQEKSALQVNYPQQKKLSKVFILLLHPREMH